MMNARFASAAMHTNCCSACAAACTSARICLVQDTAINLVVSIFVIALVSLRIWL